MATVDLVGATSRSLLVTPATPGLVSLIDIPAGGSIGPAQIEVLSSFDGAPSILVGIPGTPGLLFDALGTRLAQVAKYASLAVHVFTVATTVSVTFVVGGATVGQARVTLQAFTGDA